MQKVYLLLRNNQQTGPHSLEELVQLGVKKSDLIWIEGKSAGWYYPFEVEALKPYLSAPAKVQPPANQITQAPATDNNTTQKKIFVSLPGSGPRKITPVTLKSNADYIEHRADQIRKKVQATIEKEEEETVVELPKQEVKVAEEIVTPKEEHITQEVPEYKPVPVYHVSDIAIDEVPTYAINRTREVERPQQQPKQENIKQVEKNLFTSVKPLPVQEEPVYAATPVKEYKAPRKEYIVPKKEIEKKQPEKKKASPIYQYAAAFLFIFVLAGGGWWFYKSFANKQNQNEVAQQTQTARQIQQQSNTALNTPLSTASEGQTGSNDVVNTSSQDFNVPLQQTNTPANQTANQTTKPKTKRQPDIKKPVVVQNNTTPITQEETVKEPPVIKQDETTVLEKKPEPIVVQEPEKKQGFFQKIGSIFKKKKKDEPTDDSKVDQKTDSKPVQQNNGERSSNKRSDAGTSQNSGGSETNLTDQVDVKVSTSNNSWMIGVQGLKLTMYNHSNQTLKKAAVDVIYYNEHNGVLEKKTIYFSNIPPKKSEAIAAPDHQYADHAGYKVLSAVSTDDGLANNK